MIEDWSMKTRFSVAFSFMNSPLRRRLWCYDHYDLLFRRPG